MYVWTHTNVHTLHACPDTCTHTACWPATRTVYIQSIHHVRLTAHDKALSISCMYAIFISPVSLFILPWRKMKSTVASNKLPLSSRPATHRIVLHSFSQRYFPTRSLQDSELLSSLTKSFTLEDSACFTPALVFHHHCRRKLS